MPLEVAWWLRSGPSGAILRPVIQLHSLVLSSTLLLSAAPASSAAPKPRHTAEAREVLPFIADDYGRALAEAQKRGVPLFIDGWAPWCHTCRSMRAYGFTDPSLAPLASKFVWLSVDTEKPDNAAWVAKYPMTAWPTLFIVDPRNETVLVKWLGSLTAPQLVRLLDEGQRAYRGDVDGLDAELVKGDKLYGAGKSAEAAALLEKVLAKAPKDWKLRTHAVGTWLSALNDLHQEQACAEGALHELPAVARSLERGNVIATGLTCALEGPADAEWRKNALPRLETAAKDSLGKIDLEMSADDRSSLFEALVDAREQAHDHEGAKTLAEGWAKYLEAEAAKAPNPEARSVFDPHRLSAYLALGEPQRAVPMLQESEKDLPHDYNPPARLAIAYEAMKDYPQALAASSRAMSMVYGPRKFRVISQRAKILANMGKVDDARRVLSDAISEAHRLSPDQGGRAAKYLQAQLGGLQKS